MSIDAITSDLMGMNPLENAPFDLGNVGQLPEILNAAASGNVASSLSKLSQVVGVALISQAAMKILQFGTRISIPVASCLTTLSSSGASTVQIEHRFTEIKNVLKEHISELTHVASLVAAAVMLIFGPPVTGYAGIALTLNVLYMASKELKDSSSYRGLAERLQNMFQGTGNLEEVLQTGVPEVPQNGVDLREESEVDNVGLPAMTSALSSEIEEVVEQRGIDVASTEEVEAPLVQVSVDFTPTITLPSREVMLRKLNAVINSSVLNEAVYQDVLNEAGKQKEAMEAIVMFCKATQDFKKKIPEIIEVNKMKALNSLLQEEEENLMVVAMNYIEAIFGFEAELLEKAKGYYLQSLESIRGFHQHVGENLDGIAALSESENGSDVDLP